MKRKTKKNYAQEAMKALTDITTDEKEQEQILGAMMRLILELQVKK